MLRKAKLSQIRSKACFKVNIPIKFFLDQVSSCRNTPQEHTEAVQREKAAAFEKCTHDFWQKECPCLEGEHVRATNPREFEGVKVPCFIITQPPYFLLVNSPIKISRSY